MTVAVQVLTAVQSGVEMVESVPFVGCCVMVKVRLLSSASVPIKVIVTVVSSFVVAGLGEAEAVGAVFSAAPNSRVKLSLTEKSPL